MKPLTIDFPDIRLVVVGDGPERARLERQARALGLSDRVDFVGDIGDELLAQKYREAWCFAMPNRRDGNDVEGFGLVFLEAAIHGLAAVGGRDSGAEDAIVDGETGFLVDGNNLRAIEDVLRLLLSNRESASKIASAAQVRARSHFTWTHFVQQLLDQYE